MTYPIDDVTRLLFLFYDRMPVFPVDIAKQMSQVLDFLQGNEDGEMLKVLG